MSASASFISSIDSSRIFSAEPLVAPVVAHLGVDEVLVDRRELGREDLVQELDDAGESPASGHPIAGRQAAAASRAATQRSRSASIAGRHPPHSEPAPQWSATSAAVTAPRPMASSTKWSETTWQWQRRAIGSLG